MTVLPFEPVKHFLCSKGKTINFEQGFAPDSNLESLQLVLKGVTSTREESEERNLFNQCSLCLTCLVLFAHTGGSSGPASHYRLECGPMTNVMAAPLNIGGALCSMPQSLADDHRVQCSNAAKMRRPVQISWGAPN